MSQFLILLICFFSFKLFAGPPEAQPEQFFLDNGILRAGFEDSGLVSLEALASKKSLNFQEDRVEIIIDGTKFDVSSLSLTEVETQPSAVIFRYLKDPFVFEVGYELRPGWHFLTKKITVHKASLKPFRVNEVLVWRSAVNLAISDELLINDGKFGALCRFNSAGAQAQAKKFSLFVMLQNPFMEWKRDRQKVEVSYKTEIDWKSDYGPFITDSLCLGLVEPAGFSFPAKAVPEWKLIPDYEKYLREVPVIDANEVEAMTDCVRAFLLYRPRQSIRVHIPWCENDYQVDVGTPEGVEEYKRIIDRAAEVGCQYLLFTPANSALSRLEDNVDAWGWENLLWFGLGQKIRKNEWDPRLDDLPPSLIPLLDYASSKNIKLMAYAYPSLSFNQNPEWIAWTKGKPGGYAGADTGLRSFQDWWIETCLAFMKRTRAAGFSFDHWWIAYDGASSKYAQWSGARRILETLRREASHIVIDGRQQYQNFGPWTWLAGNYPHPLLTDEQPESFKAFPDLHTDRVSANRQRFSAWVYRVERFCPPEIMPGFIFHQSERLDEKAVMRRDRFRPRDWDFLGWKYSLLSSIATAPFNHVINFLPARDAEEFKAFSDEDKLWIRKWLDWTDVNASYLLRTKPIIGPPMLGRIDGTSAIAGDSGYVFLFNPNPGRKKAVFKLDQSIGLTGGSRFVIKELYPEEERLIASSEGFWALGSEVTVELQGRGAMVLELFPAPEKVAEPVVFNAVGAARISGTQLILEEVSAPVGSRRDLKVLLPAGKKVRTVTVNRVPHPFKEEKGLISLTVRFAGKAFEQSQIIGEPPAGFKGGEFSCKFSVPGRIFRQLAERKKSWPVNYTRDDLKAPWLGPWRLLLYVAIAEPDHSMPVSLEVNGKKIGLEKAYNSIYGHSPERTFLGFYADLSELRPDVAHELKLNLPPLESGRFQGLFIENVETEFTERIMAPEVSPKPPAKK